MHSINTIIHQNPFTLFGLTLLLGLLGGEVARRIPFIPKISGYMLTGFIIGPNILGFVQPELLAQSALYIDICLGLIMFELGRHLDISWLRHDKGLLLMTFAEPLCTFGFVFLMLMLFGFGYFPALIIAILGIATSPAVVMMVANDLSSEGSVTRRTLFLTSTNNLICLLLFMLVLPFTHANTNLQSIMHGFYDIFASILLGISAFIVSKLIVRFLGKYKESQFVLYISSIIIIMSLANTLAVSVSLSIFTYGFAARNLDHKQSLMEIDFGWFGRMFFILLFVMTGVHLQLASLKIAAIAVMAILVARFIGKYIALAAFSKISNLSSSQSFSTSLALFPMGGVAIGMASIISNNNLALAMDVLPVITCVVAVLNILGPIATQYAFIRTKEALLEPQGLRNE